MLNLEGNSCHKNWANILFSLCFRVKIDKVNQFWDFSTFKGELVVDFIIKWFEIKAHKICIWFGWYAPKNYIKKAKLILILICSNL